MFFQPLNQDSFFFQLKVQELQLASSLCFAQFLRVPLWQVCHHRIGIEAEANAADDVQGNKLQALLEVTLGLWTLGIFDPLVQNESQQVSLFMNLLRIAQQEFVTEQGCNQTAMECPLRMGPFRSQCEQTQGDSVVKYHAGCS